MIAALLFDFDGVIADTEVATFESWRETYADYGADLAVEDWLPAVGSGSSVSGAFDAVAHLERLIGTRVDRDAVVELRTRRKAHMYDLAPLLPGVKERLGEAQQRGLKTAIVTRNNADRVAAQCRRMGLGFPWDAVVCANAEPMMDKADLYRRALLMLGVQSSEALAFEDSPSGVTSAKRAGVHCAAVPNAVTRNAPFTDADVVLSSLEEWPLDRILDSLHSASRGSF